MCDLASIGLALSIGGSVYSGISGMQAANANVAYIQQQKETEAQLTAVKDQRTRRLFQSQIRKQFAEMAGKGVALDSPTAILLGQEAASEMSFESQSIRTTGEATQRELSADQRIAQARGTQAMISGITGAAGSYVKTGPDIWPELFK